MRHSVIVKQEDTSDIMEVSPFEEGESIQTLSATGWFCRHAVLSEDGKTTVMVSDVVAKTVDDLYFAAALEPWDTAILDVAQYMWIIEVRNDTIEPKYRKELSVNLAVEHHRIWNTTETSTTYTVVPPDADENGDIDYGSELRIDVAALPGGTVRSLKLLDGSDNILQTVGYKSSIIDNSQVVITLTEPVKIAPISLMVNI